MNRTFLGPMQRGEVAEVIVDDSAGVLNLDVLVAKECAIYGLPRAIVFVISMAVVDFGCCNAPEACGHGVVLLGLVGTACQPTDCLFGERMWRGLCRTTSGHGCVWLGVGTCHVDLKSILVPNELH